MEISQTLYISNRKDWRAWLKKHCKAEQEIWLVYPKKATNRPRVEYNDGGEGLVSWLSSTRKVWFREEGFSL